MNTPDHRHSARRWWILYTVAAATFAPALGFHYVGEEAIFAISALEMWYHGEWLRQLLFGGSLQHPPLYNWLIIALASLIGWDHMLGATRAIAIGATVLTGLVVGWLAHALYRDRAFAATAAVVYITLADLFFYRGWLAYVDPLFAFFVAGSIACLWVACVRRERALLLLALTALCAAFMTKALTAYVFYGAAASVLLVDRQYRAFLMSRGSWLAHALAAALPLLWFNLVPANSGQGPRMFADIVTKLSPEGLADYVVKLVAYPAEATARLAPAVFIAIYYLWKRRAAAPDPEAQHTWTAAAIALINFLPYWLAPQSHSRYLMPLYPFFALVIARVIWLAGAHATRITRRWLVGLVALKLVMVLIAFPYYQKHYRGENFAAAARDIHARTAGHPLYASNVSASGLSVAAHIDVLRLPQAPVVFPPQMWNSGFVMAYEPDPKLGQAVQRYHLGGNKLYLLCRGAACSSGKGK